MCSFAGSNGYTGSRGADAGLRIEDGIDATRKWASEGFTRPWPDEIVMDENTKKRVDALWKSLAIDKT